MIELMCGLFAVGCLLRFGVTWESLVYFAFIAVLIVITFIDIDHRIIPDVISIPGIGVFFLAALLLPSIHWKDALLGVLAGGGSLYAVAYGYYLLTRREGMGGGDIKLLAMIGALIGWKGVFFTIFVASATGTVVGLAIMLATGRNMKLAVPFGPFLALGATVHVFFGARLIDWYFKLL
jgi:leader peptidase (prepilin peptidase)/N-methyltransferase